MALSVVALYGKILPKTNCRDCGFPTCLAFVSMVVSEKHPLKNCPHIPGDVLKRCEKELAQQYAEGKWLKRDLAEEALKWAKSRAASMDVADLPQRIGGELVATESGQALKLPYFSDHILIFGGMVTHLDGSDLSRLEQVFVLNHLAQGGRLKPGGNWKGFIEFPNTVSKAVTMKAQVEDPLGERFAGRKDDLLNRAVALGAVQVPELGGSADVAVLFTPLPRVPVVLLFWDSIPGEDFTPQAKVMFDETITEHLDIESIVFLCERIRQLLCDRE
jgi:Domain of unknown function (DUF3786)/Putative Fe-S cluster